MEWLHILILLSWDLTVGQHETTVRLPASATSQIAKPASELSRKLTQICTWPKSTCQRKYLISKKHAGWLLGCLFLSGWSQNWEFRESSAELIVTCCFLPVLTESQRAFRLRHKDWELPENRVKALRCLYLAKLQMSSFNTTCIP